MKIGIMGTHGTGKTTMARAMAGELIQASGEGVTVVTGIARACKFPINQDTSEEAQRWIYHRHMIEELEACARSELVVCDRTVLDSLVYAEAAGLEAVVSDYLPAALAWMTTYDHLYWMRPVAGRLVADGRRDTDPAWQGRIDKIFEEWVQAYCIRTTMVGEKGGDDERESSEKGGRDQGGADPAVKGYQAD